MRIIETEADIAEGVAALTARCPHLGRVHSLTGPPPLRRREAGFAGLARIVTGQQLSVASADAIWRRLEAAIRPFEAGSFLAAGDGNLREAGLSAGKVATLRGLARAVADGAIDLDRLAGREEEEMRRALTGLKGIGPWTVDIYAIFCLGRADAWSPGDLALQYAVRDALSLETRPSLRQMEEIAEDWRPWRGVAARMLWSFYAHRKTRPSPPAANG